MNFFLDFEFIEPKIEQFNNNEQLIIKFTAFNKNFTIDLIRNHFIADNYHELPRQDNYETKVIIFCKLKMKLNFIF